MDWSVQLTGSGRAGDAGPHIQENFWKHQFEKGHDIKTTKYFRAGKDTVRFFSYGIHLVLSIGLCPGTCPSIYTFSNGEIEA
jgi:hypothetical protein